MSSKTISLKREAYDKLRAARRYPTESFSEVVLRATRPEDTVTARGLLQLYRAAGPRSPAAALDRMVDLKRRDKAPADKWAKA